MLSRSDCSMVFNNGFKIRLEDYFMFISEEKTPDIFKRNNLVLIQKYKSTFSICYADNYYTLPKLEYQPITYKKTIKTLSLDTFQNSSISFGLALLRIGLFTDLLSTCDGTDMNVLEVYNYNSKLSESNTFDVKYKNNHTFRTDMLKISYVKLFYDFICEDSSNLYIVNVFDSVESSINRSLLFNILSTFKTYTDKKIMFICIYKEDGNINLYELEFSNAEDINSLISINEMRFKLDVIRYVEPRSSFILTDSKSEYFVNTGRVPFPQANDFEKVIKYCDLVYMNKKSLQDMVTGLGVTSRQVKYYKDSCLFLELVRVQDKEVFLSSELSEIYRNGTVKEKFEFFISSLMENELMFQCYNLFVEDELNVTSLSVLLDGKYKIGEGTLKRRLSTIRSWFKWLSRVIEMNKNNANFDEIDVDLVQRVKVIVANANSKRVRMYSLKNKLKKVLEYDFDEKDLLRKIKKSDLYFSEELQIVFQTKEDYYSYLK